MKTLIHTTIDGHAVITHIGEAAIDPMATGLKIKAMVTDLPEWAEVVLLEGQIVERRTQAEREFQTMFGHTPLVLASQAEANYWGEKVRAAQIDVDAIVSKTVPLRQALEARRSELWAQHAVFFTSPGEDLITDEQAAPLVEKLEALTDEQRLTLTGDVIADLRGVKWWVKSSQIWSGGTVSQLGVSIPVSGVRDGDLTDDQRAEIQVQLEAERMTALSPEARAAELALVLDNLAAVADTKERQARMKGESFDGPAWYSLEAEKARARYA